MDTKTELEEIRDHLVKIKSLQKESIFELDNLISEIPDEEPTPSHPILKSAEMVDNKITVKFEADVNVDIHYWFNDNIHSVEKYGHDINEPSGEFTITVGKPDKEWYVQLVSEGYASEVVKVKKDEGEVEPETKPLVGIWDSWEAPKQLDIWKDYASRIDTSKSNLIPQIGNFTKGMSDRDIYNRIRWRLVDGDVLTYLLDDEPFLGRGSLSSEEWNHINDIANTFNISFGWSLSDNKVNNFDFYSEHEMIIPINTYLFFHPEYGEDVGRPYGGMRVETEGDFIKEVDKVFNNARKKLPNSKFIFVGQGFYNESKYRKPPVESVEWTYNYVSKYNDILGVLWYEWVGKDGVGLKDMPDLVKAIGM